MRRRWSIFVNEVRSREMHCIPVNMFELPVGGPGWRHVADETCICGVRRDERDPDLIIHTNRGDLETFT